MIVSHKHKYIFFQLPHTACTAIGKELMENYGGESVLRKHAHYYDFLRWAGDKYSDYFLLASIRNPMDEVVSIYHKFKTNHNGDYSNPKNWKSNGGWLSRRGVRQYKFIQSENADFQDYFQTFFRVPYANMSILLHDRVDFMIRFEALQDSFAEALERMGLRPVRPLPLVNPTSRPRSDISDYYTPKLRKQAVRVFGPMMELLGYEFPQSWENPQVSLGDRAGFAVMSAARKTFYRFVS